MSASPILRVALPTPMQGLFDYLVPDRLQPELWINLKPGVRLLVPFGPRRLVGVLVEVGEHSDIEPSRLKAALTVLDTAPLLSEELLDLCKWAAHYYQHPVGEVINAALPATLRKGEAALLSAEKQWRLTTLGKGLPAGALAKAPKQATLLALLQNNPCANKRLLQESGITPAIINSLITKNLVEPFAAKQDSPITTKPEDPMLRAAPEVTLNHEQAKAIQAITNGLDRYQCFLLEGVTGSGKTEVYLQSINEVLEQGRQALVLIPEIGLTPQTLQRFTQRFTVPIAVMHSGLNDRERHRAWLQASRGLARILIGTRSALLTPLPALGLIIIDEEHDASYKQQDGFRYSARDTAIVRAQNCNIPIVLGSATPSLESFANSRSGRYQHLTLHQRAGNVAMPAYRIVGMGNKSATPGFSDLLMERIKEEISLRHQVLIFINRRGYAPTLICHTCGWIARCDHCDARMTVHLSSSSGQKSNPAYLHCHHCDTKTAIPARCPGCNSRELIYLGQGTERSELILQHHFPQIPVLRIDSSTTSSKHGLKQTLSGVNSGQPCILVGTQMLAKGHHFPNVTLAAVLDADAALFNPDFRGPERMGQLLIQVAGRAGREKPGEVIIQTRYPDHPLLNKLLQDGYQAFAEELLAERKAVGLPPYSHFALIRADSKEPDKAEAFLGSIRQQLLPINRQIDIIGPLPAPMTKRAGRYRFQLLLKSSRRAPLNQLLIELRQLLEKSTVTRQVRWSIDVDPLDSL